MNCAEAQIRLSRRIDGELPDSEIEDLDRHIARCPACARAQRLWMLTRHAATVAAPPAVSPFFYRKLRTGIESEAQGMAAWQLFWRLSRRMIPAMAGITLALLSAFAYLQLQGSKTGAYQHYMRALITEEQPYRMLAGDQGDITGESVLSAIAEQRDGN